MAIADNRLILKDQVPYRSSLKLKDIATIQTQIPKLKRFLSSLDLDRKILLDGVVTKKEIEDLLRANMIDTSHLRIEGRTKLYRFKDVVTSADLKKAVREFVESNYPDLEIERIVLSTKPIKLDHSKLHLRIIESSRTSGHLYLRIQIHDGSKEIRRVSATVKVVRIAKIPYAKRKIPKGHVITHEDVEFRPARLKNTSIEPLTPASLYGSVAKRTIHVGKEIKPSMIEPDYPVKKYHNVKILYQRGAIRIELLGLALENGKIGDMIRVKNLSSNKVLKCKVLSSGSVLFVR